tara:strand:+ start:971 stop:1144 length:174 start_codon:yes stop_codon:yes gene_type:complete
MGVVQHVVLECIGSSVSLENIFRHQTCLSSSCKQNADDERGATMSVDGLVGLVEIKK